MRRGDIVVAPFPFEDRPGTKIRPALIVRSDAEADRLGNTIVAMITGNLADQAQRTNLVLDPVDGARRRKRLPWAVVA